MIRLFQVKADLAYNKYLVERAKPRGEAADELKRALLVRLFAEYETWTKAAALLRKEELNKCGS
jgi:hypothetical protein